jgi:peroxiredoxin
MKMKSCGAVLILASVIFCSLSVTNENPSLTITGQVVDYMARPVEGAEIAIINSNYYDGEHYTKVIAPFVKTDKTGQFEVQANVISQYDTFIIARKHGLAYAWDGLNYSMNKKGKGIFLLVLEKANTLTGKVVDYQGNAVPEASVHAIPKTSYLSRLHQRPIFGPQEWFTAQTDSNGVFSFDYFSEDVSTDFHVKAPRWNCTYKYTTHYQNACGFEVWRSDIKLVLPQERKIKGRVVEAGTGKSMEGVELLINTGKGREDILNRYLPVTVVTGAEGSFVCEGLPEGKHIIESAIKEAQIADWVDEQVEVNVPLKTLMDDVEVKVQKGGIIEYSVSQYDTKQLLSEVYVTTSNDNFRTRSKTDKQGITRQRMLPGEYGAYAWGGSGYDYWNSGQPLIVKEDEVTHVDIELKKSHTVNGAVFGIDGKPVKDILVTIYPHGDQIYTNTEGNFVAWYEQRWAGDGLYIMARDIPHSMAAIVHTRDFNEPSQLSLSPAMTIKGKITDPNGKGIPAARVSMNVYTDAQNLVSDFGTEVLTDAGGMYKLKAVPPIPDRLEYWVSAHSTGFAPRNYIIRHIEEGPDRMIDLGTIELQPANFSISGTVEDANGLPQPHSMIFVNGREGVRYSDKNTATDEQGKFEMRGLCEGPLSVSANFSSDPRGTGSTKVYAGDRDIKVVLEKRLVHEHTPPHKSLKDKPLPDISDLGIEPKDIEGKNILLCFFDYLQRPSRNCVQQLNKRAEELKAKDVSIVAVQISKVEQDALNEWIKSQNISFPVGMVSNDEQAIRFTWGIKSLPWLILTDTNHIVRAEGFALAELDEKLKSE